MFYLSTCVGYRNGHANPAYRSFAERRDRGLAGIRQPASHLAPNRHFGFPYRDWLRACPRTTIAWDPLPFPVPASVITETTWYRNINLLAIDYAFRPRLRSRLTLSRRTLLRKPWTIGGGESHPSIVTHAGILTSDSSTAGSP